MTPALEARSVGVRVRAKPLLDDVSLSVASGETVALIGPNGAGKTTLLRAMAGEIAPSEGVAILKDRDLRRYRPRVLAMHRAVLSQHVTVAFPCSVVEVVRMGAGDTRGRTVETKVEEALTEVGLAAMGDRIIGTLSGGEQQRAHLARVLVQLACGEAAFGPGVLLLDEPTASLDLCYQLDLLGIVGRRNRQGTTVISIMHDLNLAVMIATRIVALKGGRIAHDGAAATVMTDGLLRDVFAVADAVNRPPPPAVPYALPQSARRCVGF